MDSNDIAYIILGCLVGLAILMLIYYAMFGHISITTEALL